MIDDTFIQTNDQYKTGVVLDEYNGDFSLVSATKGNDKIFARWAFPQNKEREAGEKALPVKVTLGTSKESALQTLEHFAACLREETGMPAPAGDKEEIPF